ncbi:hypothetical protein MTP99_011397 [Tenebrio molitor]|jgi:hypothetical protein|nr:hypothetical protein MTP99_011397 [Tenebrio molitor]
MRVDRRYRRKTKTRPNLHLFESLFFGWPRPSDRNFPVHNGFLTKPKSQPAVDCARSRGRMRASLCPKREAFSKHVDRVLRLGIIIIDKLFVHGWRTGHGVANDSKETRAKPGSKLGKANNPATSVKITPSRSFLLFARYPPAVRAPLRGLAKTDPIRGRTLEKAPTNGTSSPTTPQIDYCATFCIRKWPDYGLIAQGGGHFLALFYKVASISSCVDNGQWWTIETGVLVVGGLRRRSHRTSPMQITLFTIKICIRFFSLLLKAL